MNEKYEFLIWVYLGITIIESSYNIKTMHVGIKYEGKARALLRS